MRYEARTVPPNFPELLDAPSHSASRFSRLGQLLRPWMAGKTIAEASVGRNNNFDTIRLFAAVGVVVSHAYPLGLGSDAAEPLMVLSHGQTTIGAMSVAVFFVISGYLITQSYDRSLSLGRFIRARFLRIFPGLALVTLVTAFIIGPLMTSLPLAQYFSDRQTYAYILTIFLHNSASRTLPGVFTTNAFPNTVNGSVWTLEPEVLCYGLVALLGIIRRIDHEVVIPLFVVALIVPLLHLPLHASWESDLVLFRYFAAGMVLYVLRKAIPLNERLALVALAAIVLSATVSQDLVVVSVLFGAYLILWVALDERVRLPRLAKYGDLSYGTYIYAFPIQQALIQHWGGSMNPLLNTVVSLPIILGCAALSWHLIEKNALRLKRSSKG